MSVGTILRSISPMGYGLPASVRSLEFYGLARRALYSHQREAAVGLAGHGLALLVDEEGSAQDFVLRQSLEAAHRAVLATALYQLGEMQAASENLALADVFFLNALQSSPSSVAAFLQAYIVMLTQFDLQERSREVVERLFSLAQYGEAVWISLSTLQPTPASMKKLASSLLDAHQESAAFNAYMQAAALAWVNGDQATAAEVIEKALALRSDSEDVLRLACVAHWESGDLEAAYGVLCDAVATMPQRMVLQLCLVHVLIGMGRCREALSRIDDIRLANTEALFLFGEANRLVGESSQIEDVALTKIHWETAVQAFSGALDLQDDFKLARLARGLTLRRMERFDDALRDIDCCLALDSADPDLHGWRADLLLKCKRDAEALEAASVGLSLAQNYPEQDEDREPWLLDLKVRSLLGTGRLDQAVTSLEEAGERHPNNQDLMQLLLSVYLQRKDWDMLSRTAYALQQRPFEAEFLLHLRREEVKAHRNAGRFRDALQALEREPQPSAQSIDSIWLRARLLADIGLFREAELALQTVTGDAGQTIQILSLYGWVVQNLEPLSWEERAEVAATGIRLYDAARTAIPEPERELPHRLWILKGLANALLRAGKPDAKSLYRQILKECEEHLSSLTRNSRIFALMGWCYHCLGEHDTALRYHEAAVDQGETSIAIAFDHGLVLMAAGVEPYCIDVFFDAVRRARSGDGLRRIGLCRVALHDLRELAFRGVKPRTALRIARILCCELLDAAAMLSPNDVLTAKAICEFVKRATGGPLDFSELENRAMLARMESALALNRLDELGSLELLRNSATLYSQMKQEVLEAIPSGSKGERAEPLVHVRLGSYKPDSFTLMRTEADEISTIAANLWGQVWERCAQANDVVGLELAAKNALLEDIYISEPKRGIEMVQTLTRAGASDSMKPSEFEILLRGIYRKVGAIKAFLDAKEIIESLSPKESDLFLVTLLKLFPYSHPDDQWLYMQDGDGYLRIPNEDAVIAPIRRFLTLATFQDIQTVLAEVTTVC